MWSPSDGAREKIAEDTGELFSHLLVGAGSCCGSRTRGPGEERVCAGCRRWKAWWGRSHLFSCVLRLRNDGGVGARLVDAELVETAGQARAIGDGVDGAIARGWWSWESRWHR